MKSETEVMTPVAAEHWELILFVAAENERTRSVQRNLERICLEHLAGRYSIRVVNIIEEPERAGEFDIFATPTLIRLKPEPIRRIIGDLSHTRKALHGLGLQPAYNMAIETQHEKNR